MIQIVIFSSSESRGDVSIVLPQLLPFRLHPSLFGPLDQAMLIQQLHLGLNGVKLVNTSIHLAELLKDSDFCLYLSLHVSSVLLALRQISFGGLLT